MPAPPKPRAQTHCPAERSALGGRITLDDAPALWKRVAGVLDRALRLERVTVDLDGVESIDGACLALLVHLQAELSRRRVPCQLQGARPEVQRLLSLYGRKRRFRRRPARRARPVLAQIGDATAEAGSALVGALHFLGELLMTALARAAQAELAQPARAPGARSFSSSSEQFVSYLDESVQGLDVGSAVKFRGVAVGRSRRSRSRPISATSRSRSSSTPRSASA